MGTAGHLLGESGDCSWLLVCHWEPPCSGSCSTLVLSSSKSAAGLAAADASVSAEDAGSGFPSVSGPAFEH